MKQVVVTFRHSPSGPAFEVYGAEQVGFAYVVSVQYKGGFVIITEVSGKRTAYSAADVHQVVEVGTRSAGDENT
jgi:3-deoxy-D-arabino-heptulosonate 7-phosphate (DAHP) synthase